MRRVDKRLAKNKQRSNFKMKLSEALINRKQLIGSIAALQNRFLQNAVVIEGEQPEEDPLPTFKALESAHTALQTLNADINHSNNVTLVGDISVTQAIARRDSLKSRIKGFVEMIAFLRNRNSSRYNKDDPKQILAEGVDIREIQHISDQFSKELRELDLAIQTVNWSCDLIPVKNS